MLNELVYKTAYNPFLRYKFWLPGLKAGHAARTALLEYIQGRLDAHRVAYSNGGGAEGKGEGVDDSIIGHILRR